MGELEISKIEEVLDEAGGARIWLSMEAISRLKNWRTEFFM